MTAWATPAHLVQFHPHSGATIGHRPVTTRSGSSSLGAFTGAFQCLRRSPAASQPRRAIYVTFGIAGLDLRIGYPVGGVFTFEGLLSIEIGSVAHDRAA